MSDYNGYTNYATWRIKLELLDGIDPSLLGFDDVYDFAEYLKDFVDDSLAMSAPQGFALDYARAFVDEVNWREIARSLMEAYSEDEAA
jgi:hypothetical protein